MNAQYAGTNVPRNGQMTDLNIFDTVGHKNQDNSIEIMTHLSKNIFPSLTKRKNYIFYKWYEHQKLCNSIEHFKAHAFEWVYACIVRFSMDVRFYCQVNWKKRKIVSPLSRQTNNVGHQANDYSLSESIIVNCQLEILICACSFNRLPQALVLMEQPFVVLISEAKLKVNPFRHTFWGRSRIQMLSLCCL